MVSWDTRMLSSSGYWVFSQPEICFGDQSRISLLPAMSRNLTLLERRQRLGRKAACQASPSAGLARYAGRPPCRATSRLTVDTARSKHLEISRSDEPEASPREERTPPYCRNNPTMKRHYATNGVMILAKSTPISCSVCPAFQRLHTSSFCSAESPNRSPRFINTTFKSSFISDGVASTV